MWTYRLRYVRCGKPGCWCATGEPGHGPYWYGYEHRGGRVYSRYFGRRPTSAGWVDGTSAESKPTDRFAFQGKINQNIAFRIFGYRYATETNDLVRRYRALAMEHHPDHGGDVTIMAAINAAYAYILRNVTYG